MIILTIKEFCEKYKCNFSGICKKIKRKEKELAGHIVYQNNRIEFDEYAEEILKPGKHHEETVSVLEDGKKASWELERVKGLYEIETFRRREAENEAETYRNKVKNLEQQLSLLNMEKGDLLKQIFELRQRIDEMAQKSKGIFGRR